MRFEATELLPGLTLGRLLDIGLAVFFARLLLAVAAHPQMLYPRYGRSHRIVGMGFFAYLLCGIIDARLTHPIFPQRYSIAFDAGISVFGFATAFSAARDFGGARSHAVGSEASGILDEKATVSRSEMVEHCFYQLLNLAQIMYLYLLAAIGDRPMARIALAVSMTLPWLARSRFPVNSFSANYSKPGVGGTTPLIRFLYRMKKWQYLLSPTAWSTWPSWWRHSWPPRAPQTAFEGLRLLYALGRRGMAPQTTARSDGSSARGRPS